MLKDLIKYPTPTGIEYTPDIRFFNEELFSFIDDLKETAIANKLDGLSGPQVGSYYNVVIAKQEKDFLELINPRIINKKGLVNTTEYTSYFPNIPANMVRYETITLIYEDRNGIQHALKADGHLSIVLQRKIDYLFGANFLVKLKDKKKEEFESLLLSNGMNCPTANEQKFSRDYFVKMSNAIMVIMILLTIYSLFLSDTATPNTLWTYQLYLASSVFIINIAYILYSYYENKKSNVCTNCFNMSFIGVATISMLRLAVVTTTSYFLF